jgi:hypothetical protein
MQFEIGKPLVSRRRQKRLTVGSLTSAILARVAILEWMAVCGGPDDLGDFTL